MYSPAVFQAPEGPAQLSSTRTGLSGILPAAHRPPPHIQNAMQPRAYVMPPISHRQPALPPLEPRARGQGLSKTQIARPRPPPPPFNTPSAVAEAPSERASYLNTPRPIPPEIHPNRRHHHLSTQPSLPGPIDVCPACNTNQGSDYNRDLHYLQAHILNLPDTVSESQVEALEVDQSPNYDGPLGKGKHVFEPWTFCEEPESYLPEPAARTSAVKNPVLKLIIKKPALKLIVKSKGSERKEHILPGNAYVWKDGAKQLDIRSLSPQARQWLIKQFRVKLEREIAQELAAKKPVVKQGRVLGRSRVGKSPKKRAVRGKA